MFIFLLKCVSVISFFVALIILWKRRFLYYYGSQLPGPFGLPLIGSLHLLIEGPTGIHKTLTKICTTYPKVVRIWFGPWLYVSTTEPNDLKTILTQHLDKGDFYDLMSEYFRRALAAAPVDLWKGNRKNINPTFNTPILNTFIEAFAKQANILVKSLEKYRADEDIFPVVWRCTLDSACETLADVDPVLLDTDTCLKRVFRIEEILLQRFFNPICHLNILWQFSPLKKELEVLWDQNSTLIKQMIDIMEESNLGTTSQKRRFLNHLIDSNKKNEVTLNYLIEEAQIMFFVGTETSGVAISSVLLILGMYPDIQEKIYEEICSVLHSTSQNITLDDINQMEYLERVIKETMRLLPPIPFVMRSLDENVKLSCGVFPKGSRVIVPIIMVHRKPEYWPDPLKFDPDRFLVEEVEKRPACSYMPFSFGIRNCLGTSFGTTIMFYLFLFSSYKYGMLSMKVILATLLRNYRVKSSNYKTIEEVVLLIHIIAKAKDGYKVLLENR